MEVARNSCSYVLVLNTIVSTNELSYYTGFYDSFDPVNTKFYTSALKLMFKDEAQKLCDIINNQNTPYKYRVEEHCYITEIKL